MGTHVLIMGTHTHKRICLLFVYLPACVISGEQEDFGVQTLLSSSHNLLNRLKFVLLESRGGVLGQSFRRVLDRRLLR